MSFYKKIREKQFIVPEIVPTVRKTTFYITCGLPGTGKTTFCDKIKSYYSENEAIILSRDKIRGHILWNIRKMKEEEKKLIVNDLDNKVTEELIRILKNFQENFEYKAIIIDGCHTFWKTLLTLILSIADFKNNCIICLCIIGDENSQCCHNITHKNEGDYSDYKEDFTHDSVPECVIKKKKVELENLLEKYLEFISYYVDYIYKLPAYSK